MLAFKGSNTYPLRTFICDLLTDFIQTNRAWPANCSAAFVLIKSISDIVRVLPLWETVYCWFLILTGSLGGVCATVTAILNIVTSPMSTPCYLSSGHNNTIVVNHH